MAKAHEAQTFFLDPDIFPGGVTEVYVSSVAVWFRQKPKLPAKSGIRPGVTMMLVPCENKIPSIGTRGIAHTMYRARVEYDNINVWNKSTPAGPYATVFRFPAPVALTVGKWWGLGSGTRKDPGPWEGELRNMWKPTQVPNLWMQGGNLHQNRHYSLCLALQLKARFEKIPTPVYALAPVHHKS